MEIPDEVDAIGLELAKRAIAFEKAFAVYFPGPAADMALLARAYLIERRIFYWIGPNGGSITCVICGSTSHNPHDVENRYCGACHLWLGDARDPRVISASRAVLFLEEPVSADLSASRSGAGAHADRVR